MIRTIYNLLGKLRLNIHSAHQLKHVKQKGRGIVFGKIVIVNPKNMVIGEGCSFNHNVYINATNPITIGNDVTVSAGAKIISTGIDYICWAKGNKKHSISKGVEIGDHVWIGANAIILENVTISGKYVIVAANAVVTKDITDDYVLVGGCPAKVLKNYASIITK